MGKRLRKKLHRDEFQELGFGIAWHLTHPARAQNDELFFDALLETIRENGLTFGGGGSLTQGSGFVCKAGRGSPSEEGRSRIAAWFRELAAVPATVGPLEDAWHRSPPQVVSVREWIGRGGDVIIVPPVRRSGARRE